jgi:hypothetical protein
MGESAKGRKAGGAKNSARRGPRFALSLVRAGFEPVP